MTNIVTIIVNTSDGFEDCWQPFFKLFNQYWGNCAYPILLNTESKIFENPFPELNISSTQVAKDTNKSRLSWSECLIRALNQVKTPLVLYMQEDYFISKPVKSELIEEFANMMIENEDIKYIGLTWFGNSPPFSEWEEDKRLKIVSKNSKYRVSTQASLWKKDTLLSYLNVDENGWMFEILGSQRAKNRNDLFLTINRDIYRNDGMINYTHTGIIKGKWHPAIPLLFKKHDIEINFDIRGFYKPMPSILSKLGTFKKFLRKPRQILKWLLNQYK